jgi:glucosamine--fructose-6-phosphate aminotransferase (isomerizing)
MTIANHHTYQEVISQPLAWAQALDEIQSRRDEVYQLWNEHNNSSLLFIGCGSTYYLSLAAASLVQELTGHASRAVPASELMCYPKAVLAADKPTLLVAISRSGTTSETVVAVRKFKDMGYGPIVAITNYGDTPLTDLADLTISLPAGQEQSVAQTRSFASMYVAVTALATAMAGRDDLLEAMSALPNYGESLINSCEGEARKIGQNMDLDRYYFLGSGPRYGLACEANLKMKEMTLTHSEPFHFMEFRHGPMSMVTDTSMVIGLLSQLNCKIELAVLEEMAQLGSCVLSIGESETDISFESNLPEFIHNVLYLPPLQLMAYYRAVAKGLNPDRPKNLTAVVQLDME